MILYDTFIFLESLRYVYIFKIDVMQTLYIDNGVNRIVFLFKGNLYTFRWSLSPFICMKPMHGNKYVL